MILVVAEQKDGKLNRASWETVAAAQQLSGEKVSSAPPAWHTPHRVVVGAPRVVSSPAAFLPSPQPASLIYGFAPEYAFTLGLLAGAAVAVVGVLMGLGLLSLRSPRVTEFAPQPLPKKAF